QDLPIFLRENPGSHIVETKWNSFSRIDVVEGITGDCTPGSKDPVFNQPQCADEGLIAKIFIDGGAGTNVISWDGSLNSRQGLTSWIQYIPFTLEQDPKVLIIGSGGGRDVVAALVSGSRDVTSVEINPIIFETVQSYGKKAGNVYSHQYVDANVDEGRSFVSKSDEKYDIIYIPFVDTWASVSSGGLGVSENFLYTVEAFQEYYDHLSENGKIVSVRWLIDAPRFVSTYAELLERNGVSQSRLSEHLVVVSSESVTKDPSVTMVVFSKTPFAQSEINYFHESFSSNGYKPIVIPDRVALEPYKSFLNGEISQEEFHNKFSQKAHPVTDDSPFFLSFEKPIPKILEVLFYISIAIAAGFLVGPYLFIRRTQSVQLNRGLVCLYFAALGIGFILVELSLLQKLILLLGNPTMTFAILLFTILISSGIGSLVSSKIVSKNTKNLSLMIGCIIAIGALYIVVVPSIVYSVISEEFVTKTIISVGLLFPIGFAMGMPLPTIMRFLKSYEPGLVPWMWAVNGAFSVLGAILSVVIGILFGASYAMALGLGVYSVAMAVSLAWKKKPIEVLASR
ncbi:MAG: hypothetical protein GWN01_08935, partial [Nitrosopumilaceae archaeon]|nr:hypothetical protein [Nitrosopumilaceae archaeon]NIU01033.1 hypothetical protein [Nitrosopumilaceae archaeon]NIU87467.1 hypothetical protein [Nitrosopumilaceae archaeon]NIV65515.1 hypothetical protein [Nitrosopumilaceae archaeon]NIX61635.1 hypothetical protein [Nitrosopumilaceae archaeon]